MIRIQLVGGLGNQMFQYAAARALAEQHATSVVLDLTWFSQPFDSNTTPRFYELNCFDLDASVQKFTGTITERLRGKLHSYSHYNEPHFHFDPKFHTQPDMTVLAGYFQSEKYFVKYRPQLLEAFAWQQAPAGKNKQLLAQIAADSASVSIHVRRGDYVANKQAAAFHGAKTLKYYQAGLAYIKKQVSKPTLYVFSDDPDWCRTHLKFAEQTHYISHNTQGSEDMRLMKACRHNIIANSSFSWWGAWLNENPDKLVVGPKAWFAHTQSNTKDVIPAAWHSV